MLLMWPYADAPTYILGSHNIGWGSKNQTKKAKPEQVLPLGEYMKKSGG